MIKVMLVDDHSLVRAGIRRILEDYHGIRIVAEAASGEEALNAARTQPIDVVLMDLNMPGIGGLEATRRLLTQNPQLRIVVVTAHSGEPFPTRLLEAGAVGYISKGAAAGEIVLAIQQAYAGERYIGADVAQSLALTMLPGGGGTPFDKLSQRELQIMLMILQGQSTQVISDKLCLSPKTISTYRYRMFDKLGVHNDVELTQMAMRHHIIAQAPAA